MLTLQLFHAADSFCPDHLFSTPFNLPPLVEVAELQVFHLQNAAATSLATSFMIARSSIFFSRFASDNEWNQVFHAADNLDLIHRVITPFACLALPPHRQANCGTQCQSHSITHDDDISQLCTQCHVTETLLSMCAANGVRYLVCKY